MRDRGVAIRSARKIGLGTLALAAIVSGVLVATAPASPGNGKSAAVINGEFSDSCRDFAARSSKDISHVVIRYADGRVAKDESTTAPDYSTDGGAGDEIESVDVKSGTTTETFTCAATSSPPDAVLEIQTAGCILVSEANWHCREASLPRTVWESLDGGAGFGCSRVNDCDTTFHFRGTSSTDPDDDIASWSMEFVDPFSGAVVGSASGDWATQPPTDLTHTIPLSTAAVRVNLTVTDSTGQSDTDTLVVTVGLPD